MNRLYLFFNAILTFALGVALSVVVILLIREVLPSVL